MASSTIDRRLQANIISQASKRETCSECTSQTSTNSTCQCTYTRFSPSLQTLPKEIPTSNRLLSSRPLSTSHPQISPSLCPNRRVTSEGRHLSSNSPTTYVPIYRLNPPFPNHNRPRPNTGCLCSRNPRYRAIQFQRRRCLITNTSHLCRAARRARRTGCPAAYRHRRRQRRRQSTKITGTSTGRPRPYSWCTQSC